MSPPAVALRVLLLAALAATVWLIKPFADALLVAAVVSVLFWPVHLHVLRMVGGRQTVATGVSLVVVTVGVVVPVTAFIGLASRELVALAQELAAELGNGQLKALLLQLRELPFVASLITHLGGAEALSATIQTLGDEGLNSLGSTIGTVVPGLLGLTAQALLKSIIFLLTLGTLFHSGDRLVQWCLRISPLLEVNTSRLMAVFAEFARNVVLAGVASGAAQSVVAGIGYLIAGVDRPLFFAMLTGVGAFVPVVGTAVAWVPVTLLLLLHGHPGAALFVVLWSVVLTGTIDNVIKPIVIRGSSEIPALLVFLGVFGGLVTLGLIGLLVGPMLIAMMLALLRIYEEGLVEVALPSAGEAAAGTGAEAEAGEALSA